MLRNQLLLFKCVLLILVPIMVTNGESQQNIGHQNTAGFNEDVEKRDHNIMRFGKRESWDELTDTEEPHRRFSKRQSLSNEDDRYPELLRILRSEDVDSWKRGHNILRFGKRADDHHFIHFGKRDSAGEPRHRILSFGKRRGEESLIGLDNPLLLPEESSEEIYQSSNPGSKRFPHSMIHFGKRLPFGNSEEDEDFEDDSEQLDDDDIEKRAHSMIHFGKRQDEDKRTHSLMHFGKRPFQGHSNMHFGKRLTDSEEKRTHSLMHFGKRENSDLKRAHSLLHFGKRYDPDDEKRAHAVMHFGKREADISEKIGMAAKALEMPQGSVQIRRRRDIEPIQHNILRFGRR